jgi:transcriptional regulator with XRE-family HTH domain
MAGGLHMHLIGRGDVTLKDVIEEYLARNNMSQRELADRAGVSPNTISRWASDEVPNNPDVPALIKLAKTIGYDPLILIEIAYAEQLKTDKHDVSARVLAARILRLPGVVQDVINKLIDSYLK